MTLVNDVTKDKLRSKVSTQDYRDNWDRIFGKKQPNKSTGVDKRRKEVPNEVLAK